MSVEKVQGQEGVYKLTSAEARYVPPNGGLKAWLRVVACFCVFFLTWGVVSSYGAFQAYYQVDLLQKYSPSTISWIGTVQAALLGASGFVSGPLFDRGYVKWLMIVGCALEVLGFFTLSAAKEYYQVLLAQGVAIGLGTGLMYVPAVSAVTTSFTTKRPIAVGISATGSSVGGIILPIMFRELQPKIGFGWVCRIFGFIMLILAIISYILLRPDPNELKRPKRPLIDWTALKDSAYVVLCIGIFFVFLGYYVPLFFVTPYASLHLHTSVNYSFYLLSIMNAGSFAGRIIPAFLAQIFGPAVVFSFGATAMGFLILIWIAIDNTAGITVWAILVGFMAGIVVAMPTAMFPLLSPSPAVVGARTGMAWTSGAVAALIGSPIAGALVNTQTDDYRNGQIFGGTVSLFGGLLTLYPMWAIRQRAKKAQAQQSP